MDRKTQSIAGMAFLGLMVLFLVMALTTFDGDVTVILIVASLLFLVVGLFLLAGPGRGDDEGQSQQQSVTLSDGHVVTQQSGQVLGVCRSCRSRMQPGHAFCPSCGAPA